jgi:hypothetical protein
MGNSITRENTVPFVNTDPFFKNSQEFKNSYIVKSLYNNISPTFYEMKLFEKYVREELGFDKSKELNTDAPLIKLIIDYSRYHSFHQ